MKVNLSLENTIVGKKNYYIVINKTFYVKVKKETFNELADFLKIDIGDNKNVKDNI